MHTSKLALPLTGLLVAGQALAHKASHVVPTSSSTTVQATAHAGAHIARLLDGAGGRGIRAASPPTGTGLLESRPAKHLYIRTH